LFSRFIDCGQEQIVEYFQNAEKAMKPLSESIETLFDRSAEEIRDEFPGVFRDFMSALNSGRIRAAEKDGSGWRVNLWVKKGILLGFRMGRIVKMPVRDEWNFYDKGTFPLKDLSESRNLRVVPGGSSIRDGVYIGERVTCMPPMYINTGAYVDDDTMIDSHALAGSCAQIGKRVHLSAASQIGGVLEPIGSLPVIIEDDVIVGGNCGVYEGTIVGRGAVLGAGVILTASTPVYDVVNSEVYRRTPEQPLKIPENAVVVPGSRSLSKGSFKGLSVYTPIIIKYRDQKTDDAVTLEDSLR
jgi:2,3,4,5-tetrahydropyridine-2-carboxylate N-succinyltransferase